MMRSGHRSAIVWSLPEDDAVGWLSLGDEDFAAEAQAAMGGFLGNVVMLAPRSSYPLGFHHAAQITAKRLALVGDAAHAIHPIAGQGLNLGFRDVAALAEVLVEGARLGLDLGDRQLLDRYERWRSLDALSVALATDTLTRIYSIPGATASAVRRFGMGLNSGGSPPCCNHLMSEARGTSGELPLLLRGVADLITGSRRLDLHAAGDGHSVELHQLHEQLAARGEVGRLDQGLLGRARTARSGSPVDQRGVVEPRDRLPIDAKPWRSAKRRASRSSPARSTGLRTCSPPSPSSSASTWRTASSRSTRAAPRKRFDPGQHMSYRPSSSASTSTILPSNRSRTAAPIALVEPLWLDHPDPAGPSIAERTIRDSALEYVEWELRPRKEDRPRTEGKSGRERPVMRTAWPKGAGAARPTTGPRALSPRVSAALLRGPSFHSGSRRTSRATRRPLRRAGPRRSGRSERERASLSAGCAEPRWERPGVDPGRPLPERSAGAGEHGFLASSSASASACRALVRPSGGDECADQAPITAGFSGAISAIC